MERIHYTVYKITNKLNGKFYVGVHTTKEPMDSYFGSGVEILEALKSEGRETFYKEILFDCDTEQEMLDKEAEIVTQEFIQRPDTYNRALGGGVYTTLGKVAVKDKEGNTHQVDVDDPRFLSGELVHVCKGMVAVKDKRGNTLQVDVDDPRFLSGEFININKGKVVARDKNGNIFQVSTCDPRFVTGEIVGMCRGTATVRNVKTGEKMRVDRNDSRIRTGEVVGSMNGYIKAIDSLGRVFRTHITDDRLKTGEITFATPVRKHYYEDTDGNVYYVLPTFSKVLSGEYMRCQKKQSRKILYKKIKT